MSVHMQFAYLHLLMALLCLAAETQRSTQVDPDNGGLPRKMSSFYKEVKIYLKLKIF